MLPSKMICYFPETVLNLSLKFCMLLFHLYLSTVKHNTIYWIILIRRTLIRVATGLLGLLSRLELFYNILVNVIILPQRCFNGEDMQ